MTEHCSQGKARKGARQVADGAKRRPGWEEWSGMAWHGMGMKDGNWMHGWSKQQRPRYLSQLATAKMDLQRRTTGSASGGCMTRKASPDAVTMYSAETEERWKREPEREMQWSETRRGKVTREVKVVSRQPRIESWIPSVISHQRHPAAEQGCTSLVWLLGSTRASSCSGVAFKVRQGFLIENNVRSCRRRVWVPKVPSRPRGRGSRGAGGTVRGTYRVLSVGEARPWQWCSGLPDPTSVSNVMWMLRDIL